MRKARTVPLGQFAFLCEIGFDCSGQSTMMFFTHNGGLSALSQVPSSEATSDYLHCHPRQSVEHLCSYGVHAHCFLHQEGSTCLRQDRHRKRLRPGPIQFCAVAPRIDLFVMIILLCTSTYFICPPLTIDCEVHPVVRETAR